MVHYYYNCLETEICIYQQGSLLIKWPNPRTITILKYYYYCIHFKILIYFILIYVFDNCNIDPVRSKHTLRRYISIVSYI